MNGISETEESSITKKKTYVYSEETRVNKLFIFTQKGMVSLFVCLHRDKG